jgi:hypothetical protein
VTLIDQDDQWSPRAAVAFSFAGCALFWTAVLYAALGIF